MSGDLWISGMVKESERRALADSGPAVAKVLGAVPSLYHDVIGALVRHSITTGQRAVFEVLVEQGWVKPPEDQS